MSAFAFHTTPRMIVRPDSAGKVAGITMAKLGADILFVTDRGMRNGGLCQQAGSTSRRNRQPIPASRRPCHLQSRVGMR